MITHFIQVHQRPITKIIHGPKNKEYPRFEGIQGTDEHRRYLHKRGLHFNQFDLYDEVVYRKKKYIISEILEQYEFVSWVGLSPKFLELTNAQGDFAYVNPGDIKKSRR